MRPSAWDTRAPAPRWGMGLAVLCLLVAAIYAAVATTSDGAVAWIAASTSAAFVLVGLAAVVSMALPRRPLQIASGDGGRVVVESPILLSVLLVAAWLLAVGAAVTWAVLVLTDHSALRTVGGALVPVLATLASIPELVRLGRGRLRRWRLVLDDEHLTYRGYRTDVTVPWRDVRGVSARTAKPTGVTVNLRATRPDVVIPSTAFLVPADQLADLVRARVSR